MPMTPEEHTAAIAWNTADKVRGLEKDLAANAKLARRDAIWVAAYGAAFANSMTTYGVLKLADSRPGEWISEFAQADRVARMVADQAALCGCRP